VAVGSDKRLLRQFLSKIALSNHVVNESNDWPRVAFKDETERLVVATASTDY
jgi:hypothetical protein